MNTQSTAIKAAIVGYGGQFNMGKHHAAEMEAAGIRVTAICDADPARAEAARADFPDAAIYTDFDECLRQSEANLVTLITPHHVHADMAMKVLDSGKHCILEKPMCIFAEDANRLVEKARERGLMLSVYHNRRWNDWYLTLQDLVRRDVLGDIFYADLFFGGFGHPGYWWRSDKTVSGGAFYDWGAHYMDWLLGIVPGKIKSVRGYTQKRLWTDVSNEDQVDAIIQFESGAVVHAQTTSIAMAERQERRFLGTKGAVTIGDGDRHLLLHTEVDGKRVQTEVPFLPAEPLAYYRNIADHLQHGAELIVKPEQARRVIALIDTIGKSAERGQELPVPYEDGN